MILSNELFRIVMIADEQLIGSLVVNKYNVVELL